MNIPLIISKIDSVIRFLLYLLIFFLPYSKGMVETSVVASSVFWIIKHSLLFYQLRSEKNRRNHFIIDLGHAFYPAANNLNWGIAFFLLAGAISVIGSSLPIHSLHGLLTKTIEWFAIYLLAIEIFVTRRHINIVLYLFVLTATVTGIDTIVQGYWTHKDLFAHHVLVEGYRSTAAFGHPNILGAFLTIAIPTALGMFLNEIKNRKMQILLGVSVLILSWSLYLTFSRGAWMGTTIGVLFFVLTVLCQRLAVWMRWVLVTIAIVIAVFSFDQSFAIKQQHNLGKNDTETVDFRIALWREGMFLIKERPFFGHGLNTFMPVMENAIIKSKSPLAFGYSASYAHNCYLQVAAETGILGLSAFMGILILLFKQVLTLGPKEFTNEPRLHFVVLGILSGLLGFLVHAFVDINFYSLQLPVLFWFISGVLISLDKQLRNTANYVIK